MQERIRTLEEALAQNGITLNADQEATLARDGQLFGVVPLGAPIKHPNGAVEMPGNWLPEIPEGHPWKQDLGPTDDAYYSFVEERIFRAKLFDPSNPDHLRAADAYLVKAASNNPEFIGFSATSRTECEKVKMDAPGTGQKPDAGE